MTLPVSLLIAHFVGDFLLQNDWMALNKSKNRLALFSHAYIYSVMIMFVLPDFYAVHGGSMATRFFGITFITHFITDAITSRITTRLWFIDLFAVNRDKVNAGCKVDVFREGEWIAFPHFERRHWFFVAIGADQLIHFITLALTLRLLS